MSVVCFLQRKRICTFISETNASELELVLGEEIHLVFASWAIIDLFTLGI